MHAARHVIIVNGVGAGSSGLDGCKSCGKRAIGHIRGGENAIGTAGSIRLAHCSACASLGVCSIGSNGFSICGNGRSGRAVGSQRTTLLILICEDTSEFAAVADVVRGWLCAVDECIGGCWLSLSRRAAGSCPVVSF